MADTFVQLPDDATNTGKKVHTFSKTIGSDTVHDHVFIPNCSRDLLVEPAPTVLTTSTVTAINSVDASNKLDLLSIIFTNSSATGTRVELYDNDGTTLRSVFYVPATDTRGVVYQVPMKMDAVNHAWKVKMVTAGTSLYVTCQLMKAG